MVRVGAGVPCAPVFPAWRNCLPERCAGAPGAGMRPRKAGKGGQGGQSWVGMSSRQCWACGTRKAGKGGQGAGGRRRYWGQGVVLVASTVASPLRVAVMGRVLEPDA